MSTTPSSPLRIGTAALLIALAADLLLRGNSWGAGFTLWALIVCGLLSWFDRASRGRDRSILLHLLVAGTAVMPLLRDSLPLTVANVLATLGGFFLLLLPPPAGGVIVLRVLDLLQGAVLHVVSAMAGTPLLLARDVNWGGAGHPLIRRILPIVRGLVLAVPAVILFSLLLASADAGFEALIRTILWIDLTEIIGHLLVISILSWVAAGVLRSRYVAPPVVIGAGRRPAAIRVGLLEGGIPLLAVNTLFAGFLLLQFPYFFGGRETILATPALTLAEYAQRGFFELVAVVFCALPLLLGADWLVVRSGERERRGFIGLVAVTGILLAAIGGSAVWRLILYIDAFGLTLARMNAATVLLWLLVSLLLLVISIATGRRERFLYRGIGSGYALLLLLNLSNPEGLLLRVNLDRAARGAEFDAEYVKSLGADGIPLLCERLSELPDQKQLDLRNWIQMRFGGEIGPGFREWNYGTAQARLAAGGK